MTLPLPSEDEKYGPCPVCDSEEVSAYTRWVTEDGGKLKALYSYIECDDCRTPSKNTTSQFTWEMVVADWDKRKQEAQKEREDWEKKEEEQKNEN